jgi:hypothetical protein
MEWLYDALVSAALIALLVSGLVAVYFNMTGRD